MERIYNLYLEKHEPPILQRNCDILRYVVYFDFQTLLKDKLILVGVGGNSLYVQSIHNLFLKALPRRSFADVLLPHHIRAAHTTSEYRLPAETHRVFVNYPISRKSFCLKSEVTVFLQCHYTTAEIASSSGSSFSYYAD